MSKRVVIAHLPWEGKDYLVHTLVEGERPVELTALCREKETLLGNIYVGRVKKLAPGIRGAFVSFAEQQSCFLDLSRVKEGYLLKKAPGTELHVGDEIVVQIQREAQKTKLPSATAELSLSGSALALYYGKPEISCSGRLLPEQKKRLKELGSRMFPELSGGSLPFGVIFRTASADASEEEIRQEYLELSEKLARIVQYGTMRSLYSCLYRASDAVPELVKRYAPSVSELVTDDRETYEICREYLERHDFHDCRLTWYEDQLTTLTKKENLENHVKQALDKRVDLPSGGFLVIEPTEALTAIDVNSGKQLGGRKNTFLYSVNQEAAREIARQIGLWNDAADGERNHITGTEFAAMSDEELLGRVQELKIMSRARPLDKQRLVKLLQQRGEVVAVTGDGTNDAPALNFANVGLSMGSGTSVAKDASDITLLDDSFASIATAVMWGRSLYRNIQRFVLFQLTINFAAITICFIGALFGTDMPLTVVQILWVNIIMDTFAAMAMASLPPNPEVMRDKPRPRDEFIITPAMARTLFTCGAAMVVVLLGMLFRWTILQGGLTVEQLTVFFSTFVFLQFWNMFNAKGFETRHSVFTCLGGCREFFLILAAIGVGQVLIVEFGGEVFRTEPLSWMQWAEVIGFTSLLAVGGEIIRAIHRKRKQLR